MEAISPWKCQQLCSPYHPSKNNSLLSCSCCRCCRYFYCCFPTISVIRPYRPQPAAFLPVHFGICLQSGDEWSVCVVFVVKVPRRRQQTLQQDSVVENTPRSFLTLFEWRGNYWASEGAQVRLSGRPEFTR